MSAPDKTVILTIDDEPIIRTTIRAYLEDFNFAVIEAENGRDGLAMIASHHVDLVLVDLRMPELNGIEVLSRVKKDRPDLPVIVISGTGKIEDVVEALRLGAWNYMLKPISDMSILRHAITTSLERARLKIENKQHQENLQKLVETKTQELSDINARLRDVVESTKILIGCGTIEEGGPLLLKEFGRHMNSSGGSLYKITAMGLEHIASLDDGHAPHVIPFPLAKESVFARVIRMKKPLFLADIEGDDSIVSSGWKRYNDNSLLVFPILDDSSEIMAIVSLHSKKEPPFVTQDRDIGEILASYASEAFQMAKVTAALQRSEGRLRQAQKMEAIGTLAGGIAHDFNNILAAIIGYTDLSLFSGACDDIVRKNLEQVKKASNRAKDLVAQILAFSRVEDFNEKAVDIAPIMKEALKLLRATIPSSIDIEASIPEGMGKVSTDPTKIYQVLMNLCTNSVHAMSNQEGRLTLSFQVADKQSGPEDVRTSTIEKWLSLTVKDTGKGIPKELQARIFDPYFTTKEKGEGTGLGLAMVHGIVLSSGGSIKVESEPDKGSAFHLYFPCVEIEEKEKPENSLSGMKGGDESILFVDDENTLGDMAADMLETLGYNVMAYSSSKEALAAFLLRPESYDLLITDQTMPEISGMDLAKEVLTIKPDLPVILYTGYSATIDSEEAKRIGISEFLMKPLSMKVLADVVRKVLDTYKEDPAAIL